MKQSRFRGWILSAIVLAATASAAPEARGQTPAVEILGLRSWTVGMVEDSFARYAPGLSLADAACAIILRDSVGFADAAVATFDYGGDTVWTVLSVVEPEMRERVRFRAYGTAHPPIAEWADLFEVLEQDRGAMQALQYPRVLLGAADSAFGRAVPATTLELRRRLREHRTTRDWELASITILSDSSRANRTVAALVLGGFPERDSTFYLLAEGIRASDSGASAATMILSALARGAPRPIRWEPAREALGALVGGTNLFAFADVLEALVETEVDPALGRELARLNPILLLDHLGARNPSTPPAVHRFLAHVYGRDLGRDRAAWEAWMRRG